jgi:hypothetical protein
VGQLSELNVDAEFERETMKQKLLGMAVLTVTLGSTGCLVKDTTHRVYLSPSGSVAWIVLEQGVRSNEDDSNKRWREEREWLDAIARDAHPAAEALRRLGSAAITTRLLRSERPYMVLTDARFARVDHVIGRFFEELGLRGEATLEADGRGAVLSVALDLSSVDDPEPDIESPVTALLEDLERYRFALTEGRFVAATGFDIIDNGTAATVQEIQPETVKAGGVLKLRLEWRAVR